MEPIDLRMASVRTARDADRRFCFEVITPQFKRIYQATSEEDMTNWITSINNALQSAVEGWGTNPSTAQIGSQTIPSGRDMASALTGKSSSISGIHGSHSSRATDNGTINSYEENPTKLLDQIRNADQGNAWCADCGSNSKVEWVSINLGVILCIECSGIHRSLGTHISKVRSLTLDTQSFTNDIVELLLLIGNRVSNMIWEARLDRNHKPSPQSTRDERLRFISAKYVERSFVQPLSTNFSHFSTADETLVASIKKNEVQGVLYGIALGGNVNASDRSRNTHVVFLALAAADPAMPGSGAPSAAVPANPSRSDSRSGGPPSTPRPKAFPLAELLVQNGAEIPVQLPAIPLSLAAQLYVEQRTARAQGNGNGNGNRDTLGPLPMMVRGGIGSGSLHSGSGVDKERESTKLQKRGSAGSRFAGKVSASLGGSSVGGENRA